MKLTYFQYRARAEPIRFILAAAGVKYEDIRIKPGEWPALKKEMPWGTIPVLETDDGTLISESMAICRYLARKYNLAGSTELEAAKCDEIVDSFNGAFKEWVAFTWDEKDENVKAQKKKIFWEVTAPEFFRKLNSILKANGGKFFVGKGLTWADIYFVSNIDDVESTASCTMLQEFPELMRLRTAIMNIPNIKAWVEQRPVEDLNEMIKTHMTKYDKQPQ